MKSITTPASILVAFLLIVPVVSAQDFIINQRQIRVGGEALYELLGDDLYGESETAVAKQLFAMPSEDFLQQRGSDVDIIETKIYFKGTHIRMGDETQYSIVNMETGTVQTVNEQEKSYMEWSKKDSEEMEAKIEAQMLAAGYSAEDIEKMREQMANQTDEYEDYEEDYDDYDEEYDDDEDVGEAIGTGVVAEINGRSAVSHESSSYGVVTVTWCSLDDFALYESFKKIAESAATLMMDDEEEASDEIVCEDGLPVREQTFDVMNNSYVIDDMISVSEESLSDDLFQVPAGFTKQALPF